MKRSIIRLALSAVVLGSAIACNKDKITDNSPVTGTDITLNELTLDRFTHWNSEGKDGFTSGIAHFKHKYDAGTKKWSGFTYSNQNYRTYVQEKADLDSILYSVYTIRPNYSGTFALAHVAGDDAEISFEKPVQLEHILVANSTYAWNAMLKGDTSFTVKANPVTGLQDTTWIYAYANGAGKFGGKDGKRPDWFKLTIKGLNDKNIEQGMVEVYLADFRSDIIPNKFILDDWLNVKLDKLGTVSKIRFYLSSSDTDDNGVMKTPAYLCVDGLRVKNQ
ncbi:DUF4465 domain-containing protein [Chitinophaga defluvii]|uniref:DUF4465 domain-containing protein n=1 Tax=Chitinophaga defluvii TaxID=3163343 RepID=A0ABV2T0M0_9BACT